MGKKIGMKIRKRNKPEWLKIKTGVNDEYIKVRKIIQDNNLNTVCEEAKCPNRGECWRNKTATFMILGDNCTRSCRFCAVGSNPSGVVDQAEPEKIGRAVRLLDLNYCVLTSVTRDDLKDGGSFMWAKTIREVRKYNPEIKIEVLIPDFKGDLSALKTIIDAKPYVLGHNIETVKELYSTVRPEADYNQSLKVLKDAKKLGAMTKTGIMVGLGETIDQVLKVMQDARTVDCDLFTIGQYLQPTKNNLEVIEYITPEQFENYKKEALNMGFKEVMSGPLVRSSYKAEEMGRLVEYVKSVELVN